jgi:Carboxypeptidase regulatory-like domain
MKKNRGTSGTALALLCSLLLTLQPIFDASAQAAATHDSGIPGPGVGNESIAVANLTGLADRNGQPLLNGSVVSSGDSLSTYGNSALLLNSTPQERLWLGPNTSVKLTKTGSTVAVSLERGTLGFRTHGHIHVILESHDGLYLRSRSETPALAQLSLINQEAQVRVQEGSLELVQGDHSMLLQPDKEMLAEGGSRSVAGARSRSNLGAQEQAANEADTGSITGTVVNSGLFAIEGAHVTLTNTAGRTFTVESNTEGKFTLTNVPPGDYTLKVVHSGYQTYNLPNVVVRSGNESTLFVQLSGGGGGGGGNNHTLLILLLVGAGAAGGIGAYLGTRGSSSTSPSSLH